MKNQIISHFESFNPRRFSNPWVAVCDEKFKPDFSKKVGFYTGAYGKGEEGDLVVYEPQEGAVYMFGQKDYRGKQTQREFAVYRDGHFLWARLSDLLQPAHPAEEVRA